MSRLPYGIRNSLLFSVPVVVRGSCLNSTTAIHRQQVTGIIVLSKRHSAHSSPNSGITYFNIGREHTDDSAKELPPGSAVAHGCIELAIQNFSISTCRMSEYSSDTMIDTHCSCIDHITGISTTADCNCLIRCTNDSPYPKALICRCNSTGRNNSGVSTP